MSMDHMDAVRIEPGQPALIWNEAMSAACDLLAKQISATGSQRTKDALERSYDAVRGLKR